MTKVLAAMADPASGVGRDRTGEKFRRMKASTLAQIILRAEIQASSSQEESATKIPVKGEKQTPTTTHSPEEPKEAAAEDNDSCSSTTPQGDPGIRAAEEDSPLSASDRARRMSSGDGFTSAMYGSSPPKAAANSRFTGRSNASTLSQVLNDDPLEVINPRPGASTSPSNTRGTYGTSLTPVDSNPFDLTGPARTAALRAALTQAELCSTASESVTRSSAVSKATTRRHSGGGVLPTLRKSGSAPQLGLATLSRPSTRANGVPSKSEAIKDADALILDVRAEEEYESRHIRGALSYPATWLGRALGNWIRPQVHAYVNAPGKIIVLYDNGDDKLAPKTGNVFFERGADNVFVLSGGLDKMSSAYPYLRSDDPNRSATTTPAVAPRVSQISPLKGGPSTATALPLASDPTSTRKRVSMPGLRSWK